MSLTNCMKRRAVKALLGRNIFNKLITIKFDVALNA